jgi:hypothetical protein
LPRLRKTQRSGEAASTPLPGAGAVAPACAGLGRCAFELPCAGCARGRAAGGGGGPDGALPYRPPPCGSGGGLILVPAR